MIEAVIFDMDGLLADTEGLHARAWIETFREHSIDLSYEFYKEHWIRLGLGAPHYIEQNGLDFDYKPLLNRKFEIFSSLMDELLLPMPGSQELLEELFGTAHLGLASGSRRVTIDLVLESLKMRHYFKYTVAHEEVERPKPHPEGFLLVAKALGVSPERCVVLEDAEKGVLAAQRAGMKCIAVPTEHTQDNDFSHAALVVDSLKELTWERIRNL